MTEETNTAAEERREKKMPAANEETIEATEEKREKDMKSNECISINENK